MQILHKKNLKERSVLFKERSILFSIFIYIYIYIYLYIFIHISIYIYIYIEKRTEKNGTFLLKNGKEQNVPNRKERSAQPWLYVVISMLKKKLLSLKKILPKFDLDVLNQIKKLKWFIYLLSVCCLKSEVSEILSI